MVVAEATTANGASQVRESQDDYSQQSVSHEPRYKWPSVNHTAIHCSRYSGTISDAVRSVL